ncbi:hypothetical protein [Glycomyces terrestris]|uniref:Uncharacterized protein n=1 Tax=Glycomyces terrestris TaxID=2493553 RepID=A0A426UVJ1_9ACTN|nr:hypothetical protein [Glycomyces terrestris]RRR98208.1 hypothetical protein EIW28_14920 [Glycomyces terrestris]
MPSADVLAALDQTRHLITGIAESNESAAACRGQLAAPGVQRSADQLGKAIDRIEKGQAQPMRWPNGSKLHLRPSSRHETDPTAAQEAVYRRVNLAYTTRHNARDHTRPLPFIGITT